MDWETSGERSVRRMIIFNAFPSWKYAVWESVRSWIFRSTLRTSSVSLLYRSTTLSRPTVSQTATLDNFERQVTSKLLLSLLTDRTQRREPKVVSLLQHQYSFTMHYISFHITLYHSLSYHQHTLPSSLPRFLWESGWGLTWSINDTAILSKSSISNSSSPSSCLGQAIFAAFTSNSRANVGGPPDEGKGRESVLISSLRGRENADQLREKEKGRERQRRERGQTFDETSFSNKLIRVFLVGGDNCHVWDAILYVDPNEPIQQTNSLSITPQTSNHIEKFSFSFEGKGGFSEEFVCVPLEVVINPPQILLVTQSIPTIPSSESNPKEY